MIAALNSTVHVSFLRIFEPPFLASRERLADIHSGTFVCAVKGQCAELPPCTQMPCFAPAQAVQLGPPGWYQPQNNQECTMGEPSPGMLPRTRPQESRLDSWKEIATYLHRDVKTVQRWEKREGMPVHRHQHDKAGSVYAFSSELEAWSQSRRLRLEVKEEEPIADPPADEKVDVPQTRTSRARLWLVLGVVAVLALIAVTSVMLRVRAGHTTQPKITSL